ncbi:hypothetical protein ACLOJK_007845 [Asimina triloba]
MLLVAWSGGLGERLRVDACGSAGDGRRDGSCWASLLRCGPAAWMVLGKGRSMVAVSWVDGSDCLDEDGEDVVAGPYSEGLLLERDDGKMGLGSCASGVGIALPDLRLEGAAAGSDDSCWAVGDGVGRGERTALLARDEWAAIVGGDDRPGETRTGGGCLDRICYEGGWTVEHGRKMEVMEHWIQCSVGAP